MYAFGYGVDQDYLKAAEWYEKSVAEGNPFAAYALGSLYHRGQGVNRMRKRHFLCLPWQPQMRINRMPTLSMSWDACAEWDWHCAGSGGIGAMVQASVSGIPEDRARYGG